MPIKISAALRRKLPEPEQEGLEQRLLDKSAGICFLCGARLNEATKSIVADHDHPEAEGGRTEIANLNLVHDTCNAFKRNHPSIEVRPFLRLSTRIVDAGGFVKYDEASLLLDITPQPIDLEDRGNTVVVEIEGHPSATAPIYSETNKEGTFRFCFLELPRTCIYNDDECQPRTIKLSHVWSIYNDISRNPLHEAPACRLVRHDSSPRTHRALLFDGQHKAISFWLSSRTSVVVKLYLNLSRAQAIRLVNSVQAKIKKLPLSPFELAAKMSDEWSDRWSKYEEEAGTESASEYGFVLWVDKDERSRAKQTFVDALYETILSDETLDMRQMVRGVPQKLTEATFKNRLVKPLLHTSPLQEHFPEAAQLRQRERETIVRILNLFYSRAFKSEDVESPQEAERARRLLYQASLTYFAGMARRLVGHLLAVTEPRQLLEKSLDDRAWADVELGVDRFLRHPIWTADWNASAKTKAVKDALQKNQDATKAFGDVGLKLGYLTGADTLDPDCLI